MVVDLVRELDKGKTYLVPKQVHELMKQLTPLVEKCDTEYPTILSITKGIIWTNYHHHIIDQSDFEYIIKKMEDLNQKFKEDCKCIKK